MSSAPRPGSIPTATICIATAFRTEVATRSLSLPRDGAHYAKRSDPIADLVQRLQGRDAFVVEPTGGRENRWQRGYAKRGGVANVSGGTAGTATPHPNGRNRYHVHHPNVRNPN